MRPYVSAAALSGLLLSGCGQVMPGVEVTALVGSALADVCNQAADLVAQESLKLSDGTVIGLNCRAMGSGDVVTEMVETARAVKAGQRAADDPTIPTLISLDGDLEQDQLRYQVQAIEPKIDWIPPSTDSPAFASSPMVFMTTPSIAKGLKECVTPTQLSRQPPIIGIWIPAVRISRFGLFTLHRRVPTVVCRLWLLSTLRSVENQLKLSHWMMFS